MNPDNECDLEGTAIGLMLLGGAVFVLGGILRIVALGIVGPCFMGAGFLLYLIIKIALLVEETPIDTDTAMGDIAHSQKVLENSLKELTTTMSAEIAPELISAVDAGCEATLTFSGQDAAYATEEIRCRCVGCGCEFAVYEFGDDVASTIPQYCERCGRPLEMSTVTLNLKASEQDPSPNPYEGIGRRWSEQRRRNFNL